MKPFDGGQWVGVTRIRDATELHAVYDTSGERLMHLQASVEDFDVFARSLSIGAETMVMNFEPDRPMYDRYQVDHDFLSAETGDEVVTISRLVNAFFRWEFNSCETIVKDGVASPIDYANASPDVALTSLHYYFPWAMRALVRWTAFCCATGRQMRINQTTRDYFEIGDREDLSYEEKLAGYRKLADAYFQIDEYEAFCAEKLPHLDEALVEWVGGPDFDRLLVETVQSTFPPHEHEHFVGHYRGLLGAWVTRQLVSRLLASALAALVVAGAAAARPEPPPEWQTRATHQPLRAGATATFTYRVTSADAFTLAVSLRPLAEPPAARGHPAQLDARLPGRRDGGTARRAPRSGPARDASGHAALRDAAPDGRPARAAFRSSQPPAPAAASWHPGREREDLRREQPGPRNRRPRPSCL